jgi:hypothetical protein
MSKTWKRLPTDGEEQWGDTLEDAIVEIRDEVVIRANTNHTHTIPNIDGLQNVLNGKADLNHEHTDMANGTIDSIEGLRQLLDYITKQLGQIESSLWLITPDMDPVTISATVSLTPGHIRVTPTAWPNILVTWWEYILRHNGMILMRQETTCPVFEFGITPQLHGTTVQIQVIAHVWQASKASEQINFTINYVPTWLDEQIASLQTQMNTLNVGNIVEGIWQDENTLNGIANILKDSPTLIRKLSDELQNRR